MRMTRGGCSRPWKRAMIDLNPGYLAIVKRILVEHVPECEVRAFGSRATWTAKDYSDLDLAVVGKGLLGWKTLGRLKEAFEESDLPMRVDVLDWHDISEDFRRVIEQGYVVVQEAAKQASAGEWRRASLGDVIDLQLSSVDKKTKANEQAVQLCNYMDVYRNSFIHAGMDFMTATATEREIARCSLAAGDVVITKDSEKYDDIGVPALVREDVPNLVCGYHLAILRPRPSEVDGTFLFYALSSVGAQQQFHSFANGVTRFGLRKADIGLVEVPLPPLPEQRAIAHVLGTLDDKIELNRRMNETLEAMARALFKSWFVDFEPVRAKMEGRWRRGESLAGLPAEHYDLFPDRLVPSELGEVPEGWGVKALGEISQKPQYGYTASAKDEPIGPKFLRITDINKKAWIEWDSVPYCEVSDEDFEKYRLRRGDVLIARMADPGHGCMIEESLNAVFASYLIRFRPKSEEYAYLLQYWLRSDAYWQLVQERGAGTTRLSLNAKVLSGFPLVVATEPVLEAFGEQISNLRSRVTANTAESHALATQRDALLPGLLMGRLMV